MTMAGKETTTQKYAKKATSKTSPKALGKGTASKAATAIRKRQQMLKDI